MKGYTVMLMRVSSVCVAAVLLSSVVSLALTPVPAQACEMPPIIIVYGPVGGDALAGTSQVTAEIKNSKVAAEMVLFMVDGTIFAASKTPAEGTKYVVDWKTTSLANGEHKLSAAAVLANGSVLNSEIVPVVVKNEPAPDGQ